MTYTEMRDRPNRPAPHKFAHSLTESHNSLPDQGDSYLGDWAEFYASLGWPVFPLHTPVSDGCSCKHPGCGSPGKHPRTRHGVKDATTDLAKVRQWWAKWPDANIGLATGIAFDVLDLDSEAAIDALEAAQPTDPADVGEWGPIAGTGRGVHIYYGPSGLGNRAGILEGTDWRGKGGYVVAPPSLHASGSLYWWGKSRCGWTVDGDPDAPVPLPEVPEWLRDLVDPPRPLQPIQAPTASHSRSRKGGKVKYEAYAAAALLNEVEAVRNAPVGARNDTLNKAAMSLGQLIPSKALDLTEVWGALSEAGLASGLEPSEVGRTLESGLRAGFKTPREVRP